MNRLERARPKIDPQKIRKHSDIVSEKKETLLILGDRTQTDFGYVILGVTNKFFETSYMAMAPLGTTPVWLHAKKARAYRVAAGFGYYQEFDEELVMVKSQRLEPGDEVLAAPGTAHRVTSGPVKLELYVTQEGKYSANLEELKPVETPATVPAGDLQSVTRESILASAPRSIPGHRRSARVAAQIAAQRGGVAAAAQANIASNKVAKVDSFFRNADSGVNASPIMDFSDEG